MNRFLQNFLRDSPGKLFEVRYNLELLRQQILIGETQTHRILKQIYQQIHTLKGSSAAFGIESVRTLAHELENLLDSLCFNEIICDSAALDLVENYFKKIEIALVAFEHREITVMLPDLPVSNCDLTIAQIQAKFELSDNYLPANVLDKLSEREKHFLQQVATGSATIYVLGVKFPFQSFQIMLQDFRRQLQRDGEIVATLPGNSAASAEIALQIIFVANQISPNFLVTVKAFDAEILSAKQTQVSIAETTATAFLAGRRAALELGKEIDFDIFGGELLINKEPATALTTALLHIITNAVVHGIESPAERSLKQKQARGMLSVKAELRAGLISVIVSDDGRGIDFEKMPQATAKIFANADDSNDLILFEGHKRIFMLGFSTAAADLSKIAGRGVGLSAAESVITNLDGTIMVSSEVGRGTSFEILIPLK